MCSLGCVCVWVWKEEGVCAGWGDRVTPIYLGCSVHRQQSTRTKSTNGGQVYNNTTFSVCGRGGCGVYVWRGEVWCVCVEGGGGESVGHVAPVSPVQHPRQQHMSHL